MAEAAPDGEKKGGGMMSFIIAMVLVTLVCGGAGFFAGNQLKRNQAAAAAGGDGHGHGKQKISEAKTEPKSALQLLTLPPIVMNLVGDRSGWIRLETAVLIEVEKTVQPGLAAQLADDMTALVRTLTLKQISGPSGYQHLREELVDRLATRTNGRVKDVAIQSMVLE